MIVPHAVRDTNWSPIDEPDVEERPQNPRDHLVRALIALLSTAGAALLLAGSVGPSAAGSSGTHTAEARRSIDAGDTRKESPAVSGSVPDARPGARAPRVDRTVATRVSPMPALPPDRARDPARQPSDVARRLAPVVSLTWKSRAGTASYEIELVRSGTVIYAGRSASAELVLPPTWRRDGRSYRLQPEDEVFVWPVVDGRRGRAVVSGRLTFDVTPVALSAELAPPPRS